MRLKELFADGFHQASAAPFAIVLTANVKVVPHIIYYIYMSDPWYREFNSAFWLTLSGALFAFGGVVLQAVLKSRCKEFHCCGIGCVRDPLPAEEMHHLDLDTSALDKDKRPDTLAQV